MQILDCLEFIGQQPKDHYAHEYEEYLNFFKLLSYATKPIKCINVPNCWAPFVTYLGHPIQNSLCMANTLNSPQWDCDRMVWSHLYEQMTDKRRAIEIISSCRPELVHALYCMDTEWPCPLRQTSHADEFLVTNNGSFFRDEITLYRRKLTQWVQTKKKAVLVPCAAVKPYPAPLHKAVMERINLDEWHLITATGVLGLVPQELWDVMPHYDSGLPNIQRCIDTVAWFFSRHEYDRVVVYSDFYAYAIKQGLEKARYCDASFVLGHHYRDHYENLMLEENLQAMERAVRDE